MQGYNHEEAFDEGYIQVSDIHKVYYTQYGRQDGKTVLFLHGGPGGGTSKANTEFFDPSIYRVVLIDQRGGGKSRPVAEVRENTTQLLIADIETLRTKLSIESWDVVFGGSWGSTLSLAYAQAHPTVVRALVLRGIFLGMNWEFDWTLRGGGASTLFPDRWADFVGYLPEDKRSDPMKAYHELLMSEGHATSLKAAWHWNRWELSVSTLTLAEDAYAKLDDEDWCLQHARIEAHYFVNENFSAGDKAILRPENIERIKNIPRSI
ncbi:hypothetical protein LTR70_005087 [Exophiala xenobiotica]|uniref:Proline iminopeptidase n=1 Tax=Lithohypha guttulata TaxID=1690604 RepID=A0ABR0K8X2_9EURO|nr:hypothetical protein LTR24_005563 [Lithohypha guttulata]KAK5319334.1 hypothetical protein LTR70_005087 [Exophiala xenobiotica]